MKVFSVYTEGDDGAVVFADAATLMDHVSDVQDLHLGDMAVSDTLHIRIEAVEMSEEEFDSLPDMKEI